MNGKRLSQMAEDYRRVEQAIRFLEDNFHSRPSLDDIASGVCLSKYHFHRLFRRWAGISPIRYLQFLTLEYAKQKLLESKSLLDATYDAGLSGPGRLHDLFITFEAITPGEFKRLGAGLTIEYGFHPTPFGECLLAITARGICHLGFIDDIGRPWALNQLQQNWPRAQFHENANATASIMKQIFSQDTTASTQPFHLLLNGTNFQVSVWKALLSIPRGNFVSYKDIAAYIGRPKAARAVGKALAANPIAYLIPCHRVIAESGKINQYRWGTTRKQAILGWEAAKTDSISPLHPEF